ARRDVDPPAPVRAGRGGVGAAHRERRAPRAWSGAVGRGVEGVHARLLSALRIKEINALRGWLTRSVDRARQRPSGAGSARALNALSISASAAPLRNRSAACQGDPPTDLDPGGRARETLP